MKIRLILLSFIHIVISIIFFSLIFSLNFFIFRYLSKTGFFVEGALSLGFSFMNFLPINTIIIKTIKKKYSDYNISNVIVEFFLVSLIFSILSVIITSDSFDFIENVFYFFIAIFIPNLISLYFIEIYNKGIFSVEKSYLKLFGYFTLFTVLTGFFFKFSSFYIK